MFGLGTQELLIIGLIVLLLFGGAKIPQLMRSLGKGAGEFKRGVEESKKAFDDGINEIDAPAKPKDQNSA
ncbi:twin-arginine translocase TatA/TatE family subunit [Aphanothece stagnina]|jgi:sec-independent protein translocase protein TatA|uniref:Sec-independent protein translocase subunit TatA/TatB n=1 Tax=Aphanothece stagnina TaxID=1004305 RepID=UPI00398E7A41